jgi:hypothetical protein
MPDSVGLILYAQLLDNARATLKLETLAEI